MPSDAGSEKDAVPTGDRRSVADDSTPAMPTDWPVVPGFEIERELGRGGMGVVYKAFQPAARRFVALKLVRDGAIAGPQERARMRIEAEAASRLEHPCIVRIYEVGEFRGQPYLALEFVEGGSLDRRLKSGTLAPRIAARLVRDLAEAVQYTHDREIVHRDLKPGNVLLRDDAASAAFDAETRAVGSMQAVVESPLQPLIADFGLAKRLDSDSTAWTQAGAVLGTASYMAPEQALGGAAAVGRAADIYALGTILYESLAGRPPFRGEDWHHTIAQVVRDDPPPLSRWGIDIPEELETVCARCLEKEPEKRYASAGDLADELARFLDGRPIAARPTSQRERIARRAARQDCTVLEEIGRGARSVTYRALFGPLRQQVALKTFERGVCDETAWNARVESASRLTAALNHPQVALPREAGWWEGTPYLITDFAPQGSLATSLAERRFSLPGALRFVEQLAEVVCYLHRQGATHGNLKPSNVLFAADGIPRVVDFRPFGGLSMTDESEDEPAFDEGLAYLPPELLADPEVEPRPYTDIYSLGAILYAAISGRAPFVAKTYDGLIRAIESDRPAPIAKPENEVTPSLQGFCFRAMHKDPWKRQRRAYDFLRSLRLFLREFEGDSSQGRSKRL